MPFMDRPSFIALLSQLGSAKDEEVLAAVREIDRRMKEGGVTWDDVLAPETDAGAEAPDEPVAAVESQDDDSEDVEFVDAEQTKSDLALLDALIASDKISDDTRSDLKDIAEEARQNRLRVADGRYVRTLHKRLIG